MRYTGRKVSYTNKVDKRSYSLCVYVFFFVSDERLSEGVGEKPAVFNFSLPAVIVDPHLKLLSHSHRVKTLRTFNPSNRTFNHTLHTECVNYFPWVFFNMGNRFLAITSAQQRKCDWRDMLQSPVQTLYIVNTIVV